MSYSPPFLLTHQSSEYQNVYICNVSEIGLVLNFSAIQGWAGVPVPLINSWEIPGNFRKSIRGTGIPAHPWCRFWAYHRETIKYSCVWSPCMNNLWQLLSDNVNLFSPAAFPNNGECCSRCCGQPRPVEELFASLWSLLLTGAHLTLLDIFFHSWWFSSSSSIPHKYLPSPVPSWRCALYPSLPNISVWDRQCNKALCFDFSARDPV